MATTKKSDKEVTQDFSEKIPASVKGAKAVKPVAKKSVDKKIAVTTPAKSSPKVPAKAPTPAKKKAPVISKILPVEKKPAPPLPANVLKIMEERKNDKKWIAFVEKQTQHLLDLRDNILDSMAGVTKDTLRNHPEGSEASASGEHQADAGSDAYDRDFALSMLTKEQNALVEIEEALKRIDDGTYGICEISHKAISIPRLEAIPFARLTVECQSQWEKEKGLAARFVSRSSFGFGGGENDGETSVSLDEDEE
ncbi:MAG: TraR/DksA C4-type zinc finger protein [Akkermansia sp.]